MAWRCHVLQEDSPTLQKPALVRPRSGRRVAGTARDEFEAAAAAARQRADDRGAAAAREADAAIRAELEREARSLGFKMAPRGGDAS